MLSELKRFRLTSHAFVVVFECQRYSEREMNPYKRIDETLERIAGYGLPQFGVVVFELVQPGITFR